MIPASHPGAFLRALATPREYAPFPDRPNKAAVSTKRAEPAEPSLLRDGGPGPPADLVRCADCQHVHYRSEPPPIPGDPWKEWLVCSPGRAVTMHELTTRSRGCAQFVSLVTSLCRL